MDFSRTTLETGRFQPYQPHSKCRLRRAAQAAIPLAAAAQAVYLRSLAAGEREHEVAQPHGRRALALYSHLEAVSQLSFQGKCMENA